MEDWQNNLQEGAYKNMLTQISLSKGKAFTVKGHLQCTENKLTIQVAKYT